MVEATLYVNAILQGTLHGAFGFGILTWYSNIYTLLKLRMFIFLTFG